MRSNSPERFASRSPRLIRAATLLSCIAFFSRSTWVSAISWAMRSSSPDRFISSRLRRARFLAGSIDVLSPAMSRASCSNSPVRFMLSKLRSARSFKVANWPALFCTSRARSSATRCSSPVRCAPIMMSVNLSFNCRSPSAVPSMSFWARAQSSTSVYSSPERLALSKPCANLFLRNLRRPKLRLGLSLLTASVSPSSSLFFSSGSSP
mmetsp:Transcript_143073/g.266682  ORF Transcript_143073/g.266682 Transcript_143073/m.266682 type:complete len:208 (+) Transcript_143073:494-1117(+)